MAISNKDACIFDYISILTIREYFGVSMSTYSIASNRAGRHGEAFVLSICAYESTLIQELYGNV